MSVPGGVLDGAVVSLPGVGLVLEVNPVTVVLGHQAEVDEVDIVLPGPAVTEQQVLSLNVVVDVAFRVDVLQDVEEQLVAAVLDALATPTDLASDL